MKTHKSVNPPSIPADLEEFTLSGLEEGEHLEGVRIVGAAVSGLDAARVTLDSLVMEASEVSASKLKRANLSDVVFKNCLLFGSNLDGSGLLRVVIDGGMYAGLVLSDTVLEDILIIGAKFNLTNFRVSKLKRAHFIDCDLTASDFGGAELSSILFENCNLSGAEFADCRMNEVDLRGSDISTVKGITGFRGATIDTSQLISISPNMAQELGLVVKS